MKFMTIEIQAKRNSNKRKTLVLQGIEKHRINHLINRNNTLEHEVKKMMLATIRAYENNEVYVEVKANSGNIIDVYDADSNTAFEIGVSETQERFDKKELPCKKLLIRDIEVKDGDYSYY